MYLQCAGAEAAEGGREVAERGVELPLHDLLGTWCFEAKEDHEARVRPLAPCGRRSLASSSPH